MSNLHWFRSLLSLFRSLLLWFYSVSSHFLRGSLFRLSRLIGNSLLYGSIFALITGSIAYAATGTKMLPNFLSSGVDFMSFFSNSGDGTAGIDARSYYTRVNGSWMGYPGDSKNYLRNDTFMSGTLIDENNNTYYVNPNGTTNLNQLCLNGVCKTTWSPSTTGGTVTGPLRWSSEYSGQAHTAAWNTCLALAPAGAWRLPTADEIEYGRRANATLFTGNKNYWSSSPNDNNPTHYFLAWKPASSSWVTCSASVTSGCLNLDGNYNGYPMGFRCVSNS